MKLIHKEMQIGPIIKNLRENKKFPQEYLAAKTGYSQNTISLIESNQRSVKVEDLPVFADALGVFIVDLFPDDNIFKKIISTDLIGDSTKLNEEKFNIVLLKVISSMQEILDERNTLIETLQKTNKTQSEELLAFMENPDGPL